MDHHLILIESILEFFTLKQMSKEFDKLYIKCPVLKYGTLVASSYQNNIFSKFKVSDNNTCTYGIFMFNSFRWWMCLVEFSGDMFLIMLTSEKYGDMVAIKAIHVITQSKHFCLLDFFLKIWKLKYVKL